MKHCLYYLIVPLLFSALHSTTSMAESNMQPREVRGTVVDKANNPVPGAAIIDKSTGNGVITDNDGTFVIGISDDTRTLEVSCLGFTTQNVNIGDRSVVAVTLEEDALLLEDVVVVGYGTQRKTSITGSVANVTNKDLITTKATSVANTIAG